MAETAGPGHSIAAFREGYEERSKLLGFRSGCGFVTATWALLCPRCGARDLAEAELGTEGTIAAFTVQTVPSEEFLNEAPYAYVVVDLDGGGRVSGWIAGIVVATDLGVGERVRFHPSYKPGVQFERVGIPKEAATP